MADIDKRTEKEKKLIALLLLIWASEDLGWWWHHAPSVRMFDMKLRQYGAIEFTRSVALRQAEDFMDEISWSGDRDRVRGRMGYVSEAYISDLSRRMARKHDRWQLDPESRSSAAVVKDWEIEREAVTDLSGLASQAEFSSRNYLSTFHKIHVESYWRLDLLSNWCQTCLRLADSHESIWSREFPTGPPAHPNCRCFLQHYRVLSSDDGRDNIDIFEKQYQSALTTR